MFRKISVERHVPVKELEKIIREESDPRVKERLIFVRMLYDGGNVKENAAKVGRTGVTGYNWLRLWNEGGLEALKPDFVGGRPSKLSKDEEEELKKVLREGGPWRTQEVKALIEEKFGIEYCLRHLPRILRSFGMSYAKPRQRDYRRPEDAEERLKERVEEASGGGEGIIWGFFDETAPQTNANTQRLWSFGKPEIERDTSRYRANTFGFYSLNGKSAIKFMENSKKESVCEFLGEIRKENPEGAIAIILDNFPSHKAKDVKERSEELGIDLVFLPPYSPDLSPIEQIWKDVKRKVSAAFFRTKEGFLNVIEEAYHQSSGKLSYARGWISKFLPWKYNQLCL